MRWTTVGPPLPIHQFAIEKTVVQLLSPKFMQASMLASYIVLILTGVLTLAERPLPMESSAIKFVVFITVILNATFFFYYEAYTESNVTLRQKLRTLGPIEWWLRVFAQIILFMLWFVLQKGWLYFYICLIALYAIYVLWNIITWEVITSRVLACLDLVGLLLSALGVFVVHKLSLDSNYIREVNGTLSQSDLQNIMNTTVFFMVMATGYLVILLVGVFRIRYNPFAKFNSNLN
jgi:hypothetical protein